MTHKEIKSMILALAILMCLLLIVSACDSGTDPVLADVDGQVLSDGDDGENMDSDEDEDSDEESDDEASIDI